MKIEPLERISDIVNNPIGALNRINRNTLRIEAAFANALFRDFSVENFMDSDFSGGGKTFTNVVVDTYD